ncbi:ubiquitin carboxyl-terminal hydrolase 20-like [Cynara cardunculus var. scolymus]|uniref:ubiquitin carboxyl-terminal hydrolase 20-like n=1 Tax=Cynara cardunculus var. scolymus TaxID=59895 RepID=UPI000D629898|nr:ubiquitin carboxyl-terminal hydrolase 20-like [Cynara cardunculus var. scolymus]
MSESVDFYPTNVIESSSSAGSMPLPPPLTQTLDQDLSFCRQKVDDHAGARKRVLFDEMAQRPLETNLTESGSHPDEEHIEPSGFPEGFEELLLSSLTGEDNVISQPSGPFIVDDDTNNHVDETKEWISYDRSDTEVDKPLHLVASGSSSWYNEVKRPPLVGAGLVNLGNTCFLNAVLQCFTHTVSLIQGLYSYSHATPCDCKSFSLTSSCNNERFCLFCALWEHIDLSLLSMRKIVSPLKFVDNLGYFSSSFQRYQQEDAHEFLQCFLDRLESSCSFLKAKDVRFSSQNDNLAKQVFGGRVVSKLRCCNCNHCSDTYEPSVDLSLEIEDANNISTALESFTKVEHLGDEEIKFTCENCNQKVSVDKQLVLDQTPSVCTLHLKRFKNDGCYVEKIDKHVEFPLELDLQPYTYNSQASNVDLKYDLYAVVVHATFTSTCGHYYCYIRSAPDTWNKFDDSKVTKVSEGHVLSEEAYILFYARQGTPSLSNFMETYKLSMDRPLSNNSPKSVLDNVDHHCASPYASNYHSHSIIDTRKAGHSPESFDRSKYERVEATGSKDPPQTYTPIPLEASNSSAPPAFKECIYSHRLEVRSNVGMRQDRCEVTGSKDDQDGVFTAPLPRPSYPSEGKTMFDIDNVSSPSTPLRSPGIDVSDDKDSEVVFAPKLEQLKLVERTLCKRPRNKDVVDDTAKREALKQCRKMPGARGSLLMAALDASLKNEGSVHKRSKKIVSSPRKNGKHTKHHRKLISRKLTTSSFW